jgi:mRNA-degrading endonuclease RelE of RelBE toxin-antitoxin system
MSFSIVVVDAFEKELKHLAKKYPSIKKGLSGLVSELLQNPTMGVALGNHCYKIRLAISSKGRGKSGGARITTYVRVIKEHIYLLSI